MAGQHGWLLSSALLMLVSYLVILPTAAPSPQGLQEESLPQLQVFEAEMFVMENRVQRAQYRSNVLVYTSTYPCTAFSSQKDLKYPMSRS